MITLLRKILAWDVFWFLPWSPRYKEDQRIPKIDAETLRYLLDDVEDLPSQENWEKAAEKVNAWLRSRIVLDDVYRNMRIAVSEPLDGADPVIDALDDLHIAGIEHGIWLAQSTNTIKRQHPPPAHECVLDCLRRIRAAVQDRA